MKSEKVLSLRSMAQTAIFTALMCVIAPVSVPLPWGVPVSLATLVVYVAAVVLGAKRAAVAVLVYVVLGAVGVPVFSRYQAGLGVIVGVTGGFVVGYVPLAVITGYFAELPMKRHFSCALGMTVGTVVMYAIGTVWYVLMTGSTVAAAMAACVVPFVGIDIAKIAIATGVSVPLSNRLAAAFKEK